MTFLVISFIAGMLTVLAPCILPLLPVVIGASASSRSKVTPYIVVGSLALSIILFTYLLKASTAFIMVPQQFWVTLSGGIILLFGLTLLFPGMWERIPVVAQLSTNSNKLLGAGYQKKSVIGDVIIGASLGPIFSTCSPTYFVILASVLPASFALGTLYLFAYTLGLSLVLLLIAVLGERFTKKLSHLSDSRGLFKKLLGFIFIVLGLLIILGIEKKIETAILESGFFDITKIEHILLQKTDSQAQNSTGNAPYAAMPYKEIVNPSGFVNTNDTSIQIADYIGQKVILLDVMTYSCINCQRTFPYVTAWYEQYKDDGLIVIGIHTPEFSFEKDKANVENAMREFGITYPVVLDNDYGTWNAYGNRFWPRKYLIDIHGNVVYDHIGEGAYEETEMKIQELLRERAAVLGQDRAVDGELTSSAIDGQATTADSPETYFGSRRNEYLANGLSHEEGVQKLSLPQTIRGNALYLDGFWNFMPEYAESEKESSIIYRYNAQQVYLVADADAPAVVEVLQDGKPIGDAAGADVADDGTVTIQESKLYRLIKNNKPGEHTLELRINAGKVRVYAFTFG